MGLFIGASILTILELFDYAYEVSLRSFYPHLLSLKLKSNLFSNLGWIVGKGEKKGDKSSLADCRVDRTERSFSISDAILCTPAALSCSGL